MRIFVSFVLLVFTFVHSRTWYKFQISIFKSQIWSFPWFPWFPCENICAIRPIRSKNRTKFLCFLCFPCEKKNNICSRQPEANWPTISVTKQCLYAIVEIMLASCTFWQDLGEQIQFRNYYQSLFFWIKNILVFLPLSFRTLGEEAATLYRKQSISYLFRVSWNLGNFNDVLQNKSADARAIARAWLIS